MFQKFYSNFLIFFNFNFHKIQQRQKSKFARIKLSGILKFFKNVTEICFFRDAVFYDYANANKKYENDSSERKYRKKKMEAGGLIAGIICLFIFCIVFAVCVDGKNEENETRNSEIQEEEATEPVATVPSRVVNFFQKFCRKSDKR